MLWFETSPDLLCPISGAEGKGIWSLQHISIIINNNTHNVMSGCKLLLSYFYCIDVHLQCLDAEVDTNSRQVCRDENLLFVSLDNAGFSHSAVSYENNFKQVVVLWIHVFLGEF